MFGLNLASFPGRAHLFTKAFCKEEVSSALNLKGATMKGLVKKVSMFCGTVVLGTLLATTASAASFLNDWVLDLSSYGGGTSTISEFLDIVGPQYIQNTFSSPGVGTFVDRGAFVSIAHDGGTPTSLGGGEVTGIFTGSGNITLGPGGGSITFTGGSLDVYFGLPANFSSTTGIYGSNDGVLIASFDVIGGNGTVDPGGVPNGQITTILEPTFFDPAVWLLPGGVDPFDLTLTLGFATTNASFTSNPSANVINEIVEEFAGAACAPNCVSGVNFNFPPGDLVVGANGQFRIQAVPEPSTFFLLGSSLLGLLFVLKRKSARK